MNHVSHVDALHDLSRKMGLSNGGRNLDLFSHQYDTAGYCGIRLTKSLVKASMITLLLSQESYMQMYFQTCTDEAGQTDSNHKFSKTVRLQGIQGRVFTTSTTVLSKQGQVNLQRLQFTKSNEELKDIIKQWKEVRENDGIFELLRLETDNLVSDCGSWESIFASLSKDVA